MFNSIQLRTKIMLGYASVLFLMVAISAVTYLGVSSMINANHWVKHTYEVMRVAESAGASMIDMETGQRGYMITGIDEYLEPYNSGFKSFDELIQKGQQLTSDNPEQVERWKQVGELKSQWISEVAQVEIQARKKVTSGFQAQQQFKSVSARTVGKEIFDNIRSILASINSQFKAEGSGLGSQLITKITLDLVNMETGQRGYLLTGLDESLEPFNAGRKSLDTHVQQILNVIPGTSVSTADIQKLNKRINDWVAQAAQPEIDARRAMNKHKVNMEDITLMIKEGKGKFYMDSIRGVIQDIVDAEEVLIKIRTSEESEASDFVVTTTFVATLLAIVISIVVAGAIIKSISQPIKSINERLKEVAEGDLTKRIHLKSQDELGELAGYFNVFLDKLQVIIQNIIRSSESLVSSASQVQTATRVSSEKLGEQSNETIQVATAINQMTAAVDEIARNTQSANDSASHADEETRSGNKLVQETLASIKALAEDVEKSSEVLAELKSHSENIGTVLDVIKNIAEQTNLLALNAAIEAARAGEQGRGFAVVADEVRTLAKRTQDSTSEIENIILELQAGSEQAVTVMELSRSKSSVTLDKAEKAGEFFSSINSAISSVLDMNTQISTAAQEQAAVTQSVNHSVVNIENISRESFDSSKETEHAGDQLAELSDGLRQLVAHFKV